MVEASLPARKNAEDMALWVNKTLRSGTKIEHPGHVVVFGDINPGAEVVAEGSVIVWGRLRGLVHAGSSGNEDAVVCALELSPMQLRIAGQIAVAPKKHTRSFPEIVRIVNGQLQAENWTQD